MSANESIAPVEYRPIPGLPGYRVGSDGTVWSAWHNAVGGKLGEHCLGEWWKKKLHTRKSGHLQVTLTNGEKNITLYVHRLVLEAFSGPCPKGLEARHFPDRNPANNNASNLVWGTRKENAADKILHGTSQVGEKSWSAKLTADQVLEIRRLSSEGKTKAALSRLFGVCEQTIRAIVQRKIWRHV